jgi:hypothetical protein
VVRVVLPPDARRRTLWRRRTRRTVVVAAGACVLLSAALVTSVGWYAVNRAMHPAREHDSAALRHFSFAAVTQTVSFASRDGTLLAGWFVPGAGRASGTVIVLHGYGQVRADMLPHAAYLHGAGYNVLLFDFRDGGLSGRAAVTFGIKEPLDVLGAVDYLVGRPDVDPQRIAVQGISLGAVNGVLAMADDPRIKAGVVESAFVSLDSMIAHTFQHYIGLPSFPFANAIVAIMQRWVGGSATAVHALAAARRLGARALFVIDNQNDDINPPRSGQQIYAAASGPREFWLVPGTGHAGAFAADPTTYAQRLLAFYRGHL